MTILPDAICNRCSKPAPMMCQRCHETYCSTDCQILDWKDHKSKCYQMPNLIPIRKLQHATGTPNRTGSVNDSIQSDGMASLRRPHNHPNNNDMRRQLDHNRHRDGGIDGDHKRTLTLNNNDSKNEYKTQALLDDQAFILKPKVNVAMSPSSKGAIPKTSTSGEVTAEKPIAAWTIPFTPPSGVFFEAIVQFIEEDADFIWITDSKNDSALRKLLLEINRNIKNEPLCTEEEIQIGSLVSAPLENLYYRAEILECTANAKLATVHLIDYGNQLQVQYSQLRSPIPIMRNLNAFAFRARLPKDSDSISQTLAVEAPIIVRVVGSNKSKHHIVYEIEFKPRSVPLNLPIAILSSCPEVKINTIFNGGKHALLQYSSNSQTESNMNAFLNSEQGLKLDFSQPPSEGVFVAARTSQGWRRAFLLGCWSQKHVYLVYNIDQGKVVICNQLKKIPTKFLELPMQVFAITVTSPNILLDKLQLENDEKIILQMLSATSPSAKGVKSLQCSLFAKNQKIDVIASTFIGILSDLNVKCWNEHIAEGSIVFITHVLSHSEVFVTSASSKDYSDIFSSLAKNCSPFKKDEDIANGDIVLATLDNNETFFRAKIISTNEDGNSYKALDIDTGLNCIVLQNNTLKPNMFIRSCPVYAKKIKIAYIEKIPSPIVNNKAIATLEECKANKVEFIIQFDVCGDNETADLLFKTDNKQSLSKQLLPLIFQECDDKKKSNGKVDVPRFTKSALVAENTPLPPSPPDTPIIKDAPLEQNAASTAPQKITVDALEALPNLDAKKLNAEAKAKIYTLEDLEIIPIPEGDSITLLVLDALTAADGYITACDYGNKEFLKKMNDYTTMISNHGKCTHLQKSYEPKRGEICLAIFVEDGEWYRALCIEVLKDCKYTVMFLDYGNISTVTKQDVLQITKDLMFPSNANTCYIENLPQGLTAEKLAKFISAATSTTLNCKVKKMEEATYNIKINNIDKLFA